MSAVAVDAEKKGIRKRLKGIFTSFKGIFTSFRGGSKALELSVRNKEELAIQKRKYNYRIKALKQKGEADFKIRALEEKFSSSVSDADMFATKKMRSEYRSVHFDHVAGAVASWAMSNSHWMLIVFLGSAALSSYVGLSDLQTNLVMYSGFIGTLLVVTVLERTKFRAQADNRISPWAWINVLLIFISIMTSVGMLMNNQRGAGDLRNSSSAENITKNENYEKFAKIARENKWVVDEGLDTLVKIKTAYDGYMRQTAVNSKGRSMGVSNTVVYGRGAGINFETVNTEVKEFERKREALIAYNSVKDLANADGTAKTTGGNTSASSADALSDALSKSTRTTLNLDSEQISMIIIMIVIIGLEFAGHYNGKKSNRLKMILDGQEQLLNMQDVEAATGVRVSVLQGLSKLHRGQSVDSNSSAGATASHNRHTAEENIRGNSLDLMWSKEVLEKRKVDYAGSKCPACHCELTERQRKKGMLFCEKGHRSRFYNRLTVLRNA